MRNHTHLLITLLITAIFARPVIGADGDILSREVILDTPESIVERVIYESDGLRILGYLAYPRAALEGESALPCLMFNRGGNRDFGSMTEQRALRMGPFIADWGYVFFASNYRGAEGSEGTEEFGGDDVHDVLNALRIFDQLDFADGDRIGMWGHSRGGMMTYLALMQTDRVDAAIASGALSDMRMTIENRPDMEEFVLAELVPDYEANKEQAITHRSAIMRVEELPKSTPILVAHGLSDWRVSPVQALNMSAALLEHAVPHRLVMYEGADHGIAEQRDAFHEQVRDWLDRFVRDGEPLPDTTPHGP
jgi:dipeptidyl aminopeptidase/acylaminoacyl peptidase